MWYLTWIPCLSTGVVSSLPQKTLLLTYRSATSKSRNILLIGEKPTPLQGKAKVRFLPRASAYDKYNKTNSYMQSMSDGTIAVQR